jgi:hypothetical protein
MNSYFEIHGEIIDGGVQDETMPPLLIKQFHVKRLSSPPAGARRRAPDRRTEAPSVVETAGRMRRTQRALVMAATLAAADGPLPIGDTLAITGLLIYAGYEIGVMSGVIESVR